MTHPAFETHSSAGIDTFLIPADVWKEGSAPVSERAKRFAESQKFKASAEQVVIIPDEDGNPAEVLFGLGAGTDLMATAGLASRLPTATYKIAYAPDAFTFRHIASGWADGAYAFNRYLTSDTPPPALVIPEGEDASAIFAEADAIDLLRDMVNTPAQDMGPEAIELEIRNLGAEFGADVSAILGNDLLEQNYPMIHAVGRAGPQAPRLIRLVWGDPTHTPVALVGKGVAFDTGGLNLKTGNYMRIMKKDMGGAAHAIALARLVMAHNLPVHLSLYVPAVENSISGDAFRPGDILSSRKGLSVEIDNTDAEGRLILGDALARACEDVPDLVIDFATLTGAARVALGPDLAPFYTQDETLADGLWTAADTVGDPCWRMPLWAPYRKMLKSPIADIVNAGGPQAGSITAAIFLKEFVDTTRWVHFDVWAWRLSKYGRQEGAAACGLRATFEMLRQRYL